MGIALAELAPAMRDTAASLASHALQRETGDFGGGGGGEDASEFPSKRMDENSTQ
jgi:hypothetical protein